jgi:hypothetical protein
MLKLLSTQWTWLVVYGVAILASIYLARSMRKKGLDPYPTRARAEAHKKTIGKVTNIFIAAVIILGAFVTANSIYFVLKDFITPTVPPDGKTQRIAIGIILMQLAWFVGSTVFFTGMTTYFQQNLTTKKRIILLIVSILPLCFFIAWVFIDDGTPYLTKLKGAFSYFGGIAIINGPGIVSGISFFDLMTAFSNKLRHLGLD